MNNQFTGASVTDQISDISSVYTTSRIKTDPRLIPDIHVELPDWLSAPTEPPLLSPATVKAQQTLLNTQYEIVFQRALEQIAGGKTFQAVISEDFREFEHGAFLRWIKKDPLRNQLYKEAKELRTETWANEMIAIADADDSLEDVNRSKLRIDTRKWLMGADNRKQYGEVKTIDVGGSISILGALAQADAREIELVDVEDVDDVTPRIED